MSADPTRRIRTSGPRTALPASPSPLRVAIYTRKAVHDARDHGPGSLDAQRRACKTYVRSRVENGWTLLPDRYDDAGFSGLRADRPGLRRLLRDVRAGQVDIIVVRSVDRISRSASLLEKVLALLERRGVGFVSLGEEIDTTHQDGSARRGLPGGPQTGTALPVHGEGGAQ